MDLNRLLLLGRRREEAGDHVAFDRGVVKDGKSMTASSQLLPYRLGGGATASKIGRRWIVLPSGEEAADNCNQVVCHSTHLRPGKCQKSTSIATTASACTSCR